MVLEPGVHVGADLGTKPHSTFEDAGDLSRPICNAAIYLAKRHVCLVVFGACQTVDGVALAIASRVGKADQHSLLAQRFDQRRWPGGVVHQKEDIGCVPVGGQDRQDLQRVVLAHDDQHQVIRVLR